MGGPSAHVNLYHNSLPYDLFNLMMSDEFMSGIFKECTNMRAAMEGAGRKDDQNGTKYPEFTPLSRE